MSDRPRLTAALSDNDDDDDEYEVIGMAVRPDAASECSYEGSTYSTNFTDLSERRWGVLPADEEEEIPMAVHKPAPLFASAPNPAAQDYDSEEDDDDDDHGSHKDPSRSLATTDGRPAGALTVDWTFTLKEAAPEAVFEIGELVAPWVDQLRSVCPGLFRLVFMPNLSRPSPYATPHGFVACLEKGQPLHPLLLDRHFFMATAVLFLDGFAPGFGLSAEATPSKTDVALLISILRSVAKRHGLTGSESILGIYKTVGVVDGEVVNRYAIVLTATSDSEAQEFRAYAEEACMEKKGVLSAFLEGDGAALVRRLSGAAKAKRRAALCDVLSALAVKDSPTDSDLVETEYHALSFNPLDDTVTYSSYAAPCTDRVSMFRELSPLAGVVELRGGGRGWAGVPAALWCFPTTMHRRTGEVPMAARTLNEAIVPVEDAREGQPPLPTQYPSRYSPRGTEERLLEEALGRKYSYLETHWFPIAAVMPAPDGTDVIDMSELGDLMVI